MFRWSHLNSPKVTVTQFRVLNKFRVKFFNRWKIRNPEIVVEQSIEQKLSVPTCPPPRCSRNDTKVLLNKPQHTHPSVDCIGTVMSERHSHTNWGLTIKTGYVLQNEGSHPRSHTSRCACCSAAAYRTLCQGRDSRTMLRPPRSVAD